MANSTQQETENHPAEKVIEWDRKDCPKCQTEKSVTLIEDCGIIVERCTTDNCSYGDMYSR